MKIILRIRQIFNFKTLIVCILSIISTLLCQKYGINANFPMTIVGIAVVFPLVFSIDGAYKRREIALQHYSSLKAHGRALYLASRDWTTDNSKENIMQSKALLLTLLKSFSILFKSGLNEQDDNERKVYTHFSALSKHINQFRERGVASGEVSRCNQYLSKMIDAFENMKHIFQYRTPRTLRTYSNIFIFLIPIVYGPFFVYIAGSFNLLILLTMPVILSIVLTSLDNIQKQLENPFDQIVEDDIHINEDKFVDLLEM